MANEFHIPAGYRELGPADLVALVNDFEHVAARLGLPADMWQVTEVSDGNMNAVWRIDGPAGSVIAKQSLPYIRVIGDSWPFPVSRIDFEHRALVRQAECVSLYLPEVYAYLPDLGLIVMEALTPHTVARHGLIAGAHYPKMAGHLGDYLARSLFFTSDLYLTTTEKNALADGFLGNAHLCETTQDVVFTGPYWAAPLNKITPGQEDYAEAFRADTELKQAATEMKHIFRSRSEALIHGDLHTGSVMVTGDDTKVIDPEWSFMGPMGFDIGALIGNLLLCYFSQPGHATAIDNRSTQRAFILHTVVKIWTTFEATFRHLCQIKGGDLFHTNVFSDEDIMGFIDARLAAIFADTLGFAGAKMIRRIIGISHVADFEEIADVAMRVRCERHALTMARTLMIDRNKITAPQDIATLACDIANLLET